MKINGRVIYPGIIQGEALVTRLGISFFGGIDPETGIIVEKGHELEGQTIAGKVLVFPTGKGSTVGSYTLLQLKENGKAPLAILNAECETITAVGCIIAEIPCLDHIPIHEIHTGQQLFVDAQQGIVNPLSPAASLPAPMLGLEPGSFAEKTLTIRLPDIARRVINQNRLSDEAVARLNTLVTDLPNGLIRPLQDPGSPDMDEWKNWQEPLLNKSWLENPWFASEMFFFRRILAETGFYQPGPGYRDDPYRFEKTSSFSVGMPEVLFACATFENAGLKPRGGGPQVKEKLASLLRQAVWGNQADLSIFPVIAGRPKQQLENQSQAHILVDQSEIAVEYILQASKNANRIDFILDNCGMELVYDLLLADLFLKYGLAEQVRLIAKPHPTYVSDSTVEDVCNTIMQMASLGNGIIRSVSQRLTNLMNNSRLEVVMDFFWTSPLSGWQMPIALRDDLENSSFIISKGDANYRRWLGDLHWSHTTQFETILAYCPAPILSMRVMKSELFAGLPAGMKTRMDRRDPDWLFNGRWAAIQFAK